MSFRPRRTRQLVIRFALGLCALAAFSPGFAAAGIVAFNSRVDQTRVRVGEQITLMIEVTGDNGLPGTMPTQPNWGGLTLLEGPKPQQRTSISNFKQSFSLAVIYVLSAPAPGTYTIGASELAADGKTLKTNPITIQADPADRSGIPQSLQNEPILNPVSGDRNINEYLKGKVFVRPRITKTNPYVGEPVVIAYEFYFAGDVSPRVVRLSQPTFDGMLTDVDFQAENIDAKVVQIDGIQYRVALLYRAILTPTRPGEFTLTGYGVHFKLPIQRGRGRRGTSLLDEFFSEPFVESSAEVEAAAGPVKLTVRPLPEAGKPANFSGTVGSFTMSSELDRQTLTEDDLLQLKLTIEGKGNAALATVPKLPPTNDFEQFDMTQDSEKSVQGDGLRGKKTIDYLLRPKHSGKLTVPEIDYPVFDTATESYKVLKSEARVVEVQKGTAPTAAAPVASAEGAAPGSPASPEIRRRLHFAKEIIGLQKRAPEPLIENPFFWVLHAAVLALAGFTFIRARRRERADPAVTRRSRAWSVLERKLRQASNLTTLGKAEPAAMALERALREFIADWRNISPEGLTTGEIAKLLGEQGVPEDRAKRLLEILDHCSSVQYAPVGANGASFQDMLGESKSILAEGFR